MWTLKCSGEKCLEIIGIYKNFTKITNNELCRERKKERREIKKALNDVFLMFFRLHFVLNLLTFALEKFVKFGNN
jgi:hypothetical protein